MTRAPTQDFLTENEFEIAKSRLANESKRNIQKAIIFHNSLQAMLADVGRAQKESPSFTLFAIDTPEFISHLQYGRSHFAAFSFRNFLIKNVRDNNIKAELEMLDRIIISHILNRRTEPFLILDSYADELSDIRSREEVINLTERDSLWNEITLEPFKGFSVKNIENIRNFILDAGNKIKTRKEYERFRAKFLPHWRRDTVSKYLEREKSINNYHDLIQKTNYVFVRPGHFGERSIITYVQGFDWDEFSKFLSQPNIQHEHSNIASQISTLCSHVSRPDRLPDYVTLAAKRDGIALADLHILNSFIETQNLSARVELISRTPTLHAVMNVLPAGRLKVTLRHPLLIPEIYRFTTSALASIGDVAQRVEGLVEPYLDREFETNGADENLRYHEAAEIAQELIPVLRDVIAIQDGLESGSQEFREVYIKTLDSVSSIKIELASEIEGVFSLIIDKLSSRNDPFTRTAFRNLIKQCRRTVHSEWSRTFGGNDRIKCRVLKITDNNLCPEPFFAIRMIDGKFRRTFHIHSKRWQEMINRKIETEENGGLTEFPIEIELNSGEILSGVDRAFESLNNESYHLSESKLDNPTDDERFGIDSALLAAMAFASVRKYSTSLSISSTVLHEITGYLRRNEKEILAKKTPGQLLAFREMLLFRHYCERIQAHRSNYDRNKSTNYFRGGVERSLAQAQRDIDFAALLSEIIEFQAIGIKSAPAGYGRLQDYRLRLAHVSTWIEMLLISGLGSLDSNATALDSNTKAIQGVRDRKDIWAGVGMAKETCYFAYLAQIAAEKLEKENKSEHVKRYYLNIEARLIQNYLAIMIVFLSIKGVPGMHTLFDPTQRVERDKVLAFYDWKIHWERYRDLQYKNNFKLNIFGIFSCIFNLLSKIDDLRTSREGPEKLNEMAEEYRSICVSQLEKIDATATIVDIPSLSQVLLVNLQQRLIEFGK